MTATDNKPKQKAAYHIFKQDDAGNKTYAGTAYRHEKGNGINIVIGSTRYVAFPPKDKPEEAEGA